MRGRGSKSRKVRRTFRRSGGQGQAGGSGPAAGVDTALTARRLAVSGTYAQFHGDFGTEPIGSSALGKGVLLMDLALALGIAWTVRALLRMASEAKT